MKLLIALLLAVFSTGAMAEWTYLTSPADNTFDVYIDKATIRKQGNVAKMWTMRDFKSPQKEADGTSCSSDKTFAEFDCVEIRRRFLAGIGFSDNMGKGQVIFNHQYNDEWSDISPSSIVMAQWKAACKK